jgi:hypothetical protein
MRLESRESYATAVRAIEAALGVQYPSSADLALCELGRLVDGPDFRAAFPYALILTTTVDVAAARENMPAKLLPFMLVREQHSSDFYAYDLATEPSRVVVWSDHAVVMDWANFGLFTTWLATKTSHRDNDAAG